MRRFSVFLCFCLSCLQPLQIASAEINEPINIFVSILPQKYLVERVGGDRVAVEVMVRPGLSPETYEPTPKQMASLSNSQLYFRIGIPFESVWIERIERLNSNLKIIDCCHNLLTEKLSNPDQHDSQITRHDLDAHVWTSPVNAQYLAELVKAALVELDPLFSDNYERNYAVLIDELDELDSTIRNQLAKIKNRYLLVSHPAWGYFANAYDLKQIPIEQDGSEIRAKELTRLIEFARAENIRTVYAQKQFNNASAEILAREINADVVELDPLAENYIENLRQVTHAIAQGAR